MPQPPDRPSGNASSPGTPGNYQSLCRIICGEHEFQPGDKIPAGFIPRMIAAGLCDGQHFRSAP